MLYLLYGTDVSKRLDARDVLVHKFTQEGRTLITQRDQEMNLESLEKFTQNQSLFGDQFIVLLEHPSENENFFDQFKIRIPTLVDSDTVFIVTESELTKDTVQLFEKYKASISVYDALKGTKKKEDFNIFQLTDVFQERDKKNTWLLYRRARFFEKAPEEIAGILFWAIKNMLIVAKSNKLTEVKLNPFIRDKVHKALHHWKIVELEHLARRLTQILHESRTIGIDLDTALEQYILKEL